MLKMLSFAQDFYSFTYSKNHSKLNCVIKNELQQVVIDIRLLFIVKR